MHHVGVAFDAHEILHLHAPRRGHPAQVVAAQVDQHDVLRALFLVLQQVVGQRPVLLLRRAARPGAGDGAGFGQIAGEPHEHFGR